MKNDILWATKKNTFEDFRLVAEKRPSVNPPEPKLEMVSIPGRDGDLDITDSLDGYTPFNNRKGTWDFIIVNDFYQIVDTYEAWYETYTKIMSYVQGKRVRIILEDDLMYYYTGRLYVSGLDSERNYSRITLEYILDPYKESIYSSLVHRDWLWDPFNFVNGVIPQVSYKNMIIPTFNRDNHGHYQSLNWQSQVISTDYLGSGPSVPHISATVGPDPRYLIGSVNAFGETKVGLVVKIPGWGNQIIKDNVASDVGVVDRDIPEYTMRRDMTTSQRTIKYAAPNPKVVPIFHDAPTGGITPRESWQANITIPETYTRCENCNAPFDYEHLFDPNSGITVTAECSQHEPTEEFDQGFLWFPRIRCGVCGYVKSLSNMLIWCPTCGQAVFQLAYEGDTWTLTKQSDSYTIHCNKCGSEWSGFSYVPYYGNISIDVRRKEF